MPKEKTTKENWEKEFEKWFPERFWVGEDPDNVKEFIRQLLKEEKEEWEKEKIMAIDKRILDKIKREQGTDEFYETIVKPIEKRVKNQLLEKIMQMKIPEIFPDRKTEGYNLALAELEEKLKEEMKKEL